MAKKKKKRVFKVKNIIILLFVFLGIVFLIYYGLTMPVKNVYISGNEILSDDKIMKISDLYEYPSFLLTSSRDISKNILNDPYVKGVKIHKKFGNVVEIVIQEYRVVCSFGNKILLENGRFLENSYSVMDVPLLINEVDNATVLKKFAQKFGEIDGDILRQISEIEYQPSSVDEERFLLYMSDGNLVYITLTKVGKINKYNQIKDKLENHLGIIYLDSGDYVEIKK